MRLKSCSVSLRVKNGESRNSVTQFISWSIVEIEGDLDIFIGVFAHDHAIVVNVRILSFAFD